MGEEGRGILSNSMIIIFGLGNPGARYQATRHNIGRVAVEAFIAAQGLSVEADKYMSARVSKGVVDGKELLVVIPEVLMNQSGEVAAQAKRRFPDASLVVVHDDISIALGEVKCSFGRGAGGHNGVQSIIDALGTNQCARVRIGVRPTLPELLPQIAPPDGFEHFLLSDFSPLEEADRQRGLQCAGEVLDEICRKSFSEIMTRFNASEKGGGV